MNVNTRLVIWGMQTTEKSRHNVDTVIFYQGLGKLANFPLLLVVSTNTSMVLGLGGPLAKAGLLEALQGTTHKRGTQ